MHRPPTVSARSSQSLGGLDRRGVRKVVPHITARCERVEFLRRTAETLPGGVHLDSDRQISKPFGVRECGNRGANSQRPVFLWVAQWWPDGQPRPAHHARFVNGKIGEFVRQAGQRVRNLRCSQPVRIRLDNRNQRHTGSPADGLRRRANPVQVDRYLNVR